MDKKRKGCALQSAQSYDFFVGVDACAMLLLLRRGRCPHRPNGNCGFALDFRKNGSHRRGDVLNRPLRTPRKGLPVSRWNSPNKKILPSRALGREYRNTSWCHPNLKSLLFLVCRALGAATGDFGTSLIRPLGGCPSRTLAAEIFQLAISSLSGRLAVLLPRPCGSVLFR